MAKQKAPFDQATGGAQSRLFTTAWHLLLCIMEPQGKQAFRVRDGLLSD